jgi:hypothetical protein
VEIDENFLISWLRVFNMISESRSGI